MRETKTKADAARRLFLWALLWRKGEALRGFPLRRQVNIHTGRAVCSPANKKADGLRRLFSEWRYGYCG
ncbi:hypothetical protein BN137_3856 [Cronobacter condimenti 1330]|uniref:Uncharacterized protein n=1 Tax=Cronobacter condimenti 1330 TaxID=1073999 RepID=K8A3D1_9ENTR|nr:hypothetical protein BN137_3856 [Cronobacter condimenti 1330]